MNDKRIGIIGGMGPEATARFYLKLIERTSVSTDQDHFRVIIDSNPKIPDRTAAILGEGESPVPYIIETGKTLEKAGVDIACIPCITSHYFFDEVQAGLDFRIIHAIKALNRYVKSEYPQVKKIGVLSTTGTVKTAIYDKDLNGLEIIYPDDSTQAENVMQAIYGEEGIKRGNHGMKPLGLLRIAANKMIACGAELIIAGCTEVPIVLKQEHIDVPLIDPMDVVISELIGE
ncbi:MULTISPECIES: aspartate/glutamate racemase family protein [unclassified Fusibacter]|uniref:aspartate/glutamate racemase family protein n=1 Tax=unclassified Fusibacter TaxID=2624464 RepID=UPI00101032AE|nr:MULTISPECIES: amino acid racemase [unclassified Fusibacter]MCK8060020.1 amino acid racemase [Fusibacter sp. A2]NPE22160.1 amino acid racemase [Fusibacter sp. A1]RXV60937.1 amino acid racemase [Fusibacter sp. A1]